jgi:hypothetical protein
MFRFLPQLIALLLVVFVSPDSFAWCKLDPPRKPSVREEYKDSAMVLVGNVVSERVIDDFGHGYVDGNIYTLKVTEQFKGAHREAVEVFSENSSGRYPMEKSIPYLVFAYAIPGGLAIDPCGNSGKTSNHGRVRNSVC